MPACQACAPAVVRWPCATSVAAVRHRRAFPTSVEDVGKLASGREQKLVIQDSRELSEILKTAKTASNF